MRSMREQISNIGDKLVNDIGSKAVKIAEISTLSCGFLGFYEPEIPIELLKENIDE